MNVIWNVHGPGLLQLSIVGQQSTSKCTAFKIKVTLFFMILMTVWGFFWCSLQGRLRQLAGRTAGYWALLRQLGQLSVSLFVAFHSGLWHGNSSGKHSQRKVPICKCSTRPFLGHSCDVLLAKKEPVAEFRVHMGEKYISIPWMLKGVTYWKSLFQQSLRGPMSDTCPKWLDLVPSHKGWDVWI